ncbi:hypothetical protein A3Q56_01547 [Intoshia linei]|uniref:Uncharacterized protein n=1 Tax=Intoshia linei TaxID=1819745 RepID=A0A177B8U3_9BILA|nr:hypothetical protein A3Q56_01547 [Intoshia linei]
MTDNEILNTYYSILVKTGLKNGLHPENTALYYKLFKEIVKFIDSRDLNESLSNLINILNHPQDVTLALFDICQKFTKFEMDCVINTINNQVLKNYKLLKRVIHISKNHQISQNKVSQSIEVNVPTSYDEIFVNPINVSHFEHNVIKQNRIDKIKMKYYKIKEDVSNKFSIEFSKLKSDFGNHLEINKFYPQNMYNIKTVKIVLSEYIQEMFNKMADLIVNKYMNISENNINQMLEIENVNDE